MTMPIRNANRIQTSVLNGIEKKALVWMAERLPKWVSSDMLTYIGTLGAILIGAGYILSGKNINFLWLSCFGFVVNWFGDSLDGTVARVRKAQRPIYGYYLDHTIDCVNEGFMFIGVGLSWLIRIELAMMIYIMYLFLTINVSINAHLKSEFRLTYAKLGPTEFRVIAILLNVAFIFIKPLRTFSGQLRIFGETITYRALDVAGMVILLALAIIYVVTIISDAREYAKIDPLPTKKEDKD